MVSLKYEHISTSLTVILNEMSILRTQITWEFLTFSCVSVD